MDVTRNHDLVELWADMPAAPPPPRPVKIALQSLARNPLVIAVACHEVMLDRFCVNGGEIGYSDEDLSLVRCWFGEASIFRFFGVRFLPSRSWRPLVPSRRVGLSLCV
jgi:hypothetical protein